MGAAKQLAWDLLLHAQAGSRSLRSAPIVFRSGRHAISAGISSIAVKFGCKKTRWDGVDALSHFAIGFGQLTNSSLSTCYAGLSEASTTSQLSPHFRKPCRIAFGAVI